MQMKKSIALFIVLFFIVVATVVIGFIYKNVQENIGYSKIYETISQNNILLKDIENFLKKYTKNIETKEDLNEIFIQSPLINSKDNRFLFSFNVTTFHDRLNLNLISDKKSKKYIEKFLLNLLNYYEIQDGDFFIALVEDSIDKDYEERVAESEIIYEDRNFKNYLINSFSRFYKIIDYYFKKTGDENIYKIPWKEYIYFDEDLNSLIDCNKISKDMAIFLELIKEDENYICEEILNNKKKKDFIKALKIREFSKNEPYMIIVDFRYKKEDIEEKFRLYFDIKSKEIKKIEKY